MNPQLSNDVVTFALRPLDVDVTFLYGYGFSRYRGGPMKYADSVGLSTVPADIREFAREVPLLPRVTRDHRVPST